MPSNYNEQDVINLKHLRMTIERLLYQLSPTPKRDPVDLTEVYSDEVKKFENVWDWAQFRTINRSWDDLIPGDYIPYDLTFSGVTNTYNCEIGGINHSYGDYLVPLHMDFITRELVNVTIPYSDSGNNNGNENAPYPLIASYLYRYLNGTMFYELPEELRNVIIDKYFLIESRYSGDENEILTNANGWGWAYIGKLWPLAEVEVFGSSTIGSDTYGGYGRQYPIFKYYEDGAVKGVVGSSESSDWGTLSVQKDSSTGIVIVDSSGNPASADCTVTLSFPLCFRIGAAGQDE